MPPPGIVLERVYFGPDPIGVGLQVAVARSTGRPSRELLRTLWDFRGAKKSLNVIVAVVHDDLVTVLGPDLQAQPIEDLPLGQAARHLQSVLDQPDSDAAYERSGTLRKALNSTGIAGFTNSGLFASHHVATRVPERADWSASTSAAQAMLPLRSRPLIGALGYTVHEEGAALLLSGGGDAPRAVAVLLDEGEAFDSPSARFQLSPVAFGLAEAGRRGLPWLIVLRQHQIRLYPARTGVGVGQKGQVETFFEIDLAAVGDEHAAYLPLVFAASALEPHGSVQQILDGSARYATELGDRLRDRIYQDVVPPLARALAARLPELGLAADDDGLRTAYRLTLRILFRLLFQAYAEDRGLLPAGRNEHFDARSLKAAAQRYRDTDPAEFSRTSTELWTGLEGVWLAIDEGNELWSVPAYNGGLFSTTRDEGVQIARLTLPDAVVGPLLQALLVDVNRDGDRGPVDFRSLSVREFGTIYEGLLESALSIADVDLTVGPKGGWVPAKPGDAIALRAGEPYFHSASGERKATGSYFTPKIVVDHLVERSIVPTLTAHLDRIEALLESGDTAAAGRQFFDYRVADLAMGSGHFLVAAIDRIEALYRDFLTRHTVPSVQQELIRIAEAAKRALGRDLTAIAEIEDVALLRRQIARRCIYGIDLNPLALELSRLALWIHTFVPGLPMSNLDHNLVCANSLTGIGAVDEALTALDPSRKPGDVTLVDGVVQHSLEQAAALWMNAANADEADKAGVAAGAALAARAGLEAAPAEAVLDLAVAVRARAVSPIMAVDASVLISAAAAPDVQKFVAQLNPAHMPHRFPEVFTRDNPGFDVLLGNPPWEEVMVEEPKFWLRVRPGLLGLRSNDLQAEIARLRTERADLLPALQRDIDAVNALRKVLLTGPYPGLGTGDVDLYQAFAWRYWQLLRKRGTLAFVTPRSLLNSAGSGRWRASVIPNATTETLTLTNSANWVFAQVDGRYSIALSAIRREEPGHGGVVKIAGPFYSELDFSASRDALGVLDFAALTAASAHAALPNLSDAASVEIFMQLRRAPRLDEVRPGWDFRPVREFDATNDRSTFDAGPETLGRLPVRGGAGFDLWTPETGEVYARADPATVIAALQAKRARQIKLRSSAFCGKSAGWAADAATLPLRTPRIAFRDVTNSTNTRTTIAALVPPETVLVNSAPMVFRFDGDARSEAYLLGVLSSIPLDWYTRKYVELHMNLHIFNGLPIPVYMPGTAIIDRIVHVAGRLAAVDARYLPWASDVGVGVGTATVEPTKSRLIYELDALVSLLYGLSEDEVEHIFATFHRGWDYRPRLDAVLEHYAHWKIRA